MLKCRLFVSLETLYINEGTEKYSAHLEINFMASSTTETQICVIWPFFTDFLRSSAQLQPNMKNKISQHGCTGWC